MSLREPPPVCPPTPRHCGLIPSSRDAETTCPLLTDEALPWASGAFPCVPRGFLRGLQVQEASRLEEKCPLGPRTVCGGGGQGHMTSVDSMTPVLKSCRISFPRTTCIFLFVCLFVCWNVSVCRGLRLRIPATVLYNGAGRGVSPGRIQWGNTQLPPGGLPHPQGCCRLGAQGFVTVGAPCARSASPEGPAATTALSSGKPVPASWWTVRMGWELGTPEVSPVSVGDHGP